MIQLQAGVSGYSPKNQETIISYSEIESFVSTFCSQNKTEVQFNAGLKQYKNFSYELFIVSPLEHKQQFGLLINKATKVYAITKFNQSVNFEGKDFGKDPIPENSYCNQEDLAPIKSVTILDFTFLSADFLSQKVDGDIPESAFIVENLFNEEFAEFSYWEPKKMTDIVFNNWKK